jgi:plastocyanin domain-containing protein
LIGLLAAAASTAEPQAVIVPPGPDGVQRVEIAVDSYSFAPNRLIVKENIPVELILKSASWIVPHNFVLKSPEAGLDIEQEIPAGETISVRFTPTGIGAFRFACTKRLLFFQSHEERGMTGTLEVGK